jgi:hypothetical protein
VIALLIWIIVIVIVGAAVLAVVRAALATPLLSGLSPYANLIYALIVLLLVVWVVSHFYGGSLLEPPR